MAPPIFARFYINGSALFEKIKEVASSESYQIAFEDPSNKVIHLHKKVRGRTIHLIIYVGDGKDRSIAIEVKPGYEGIYMDYGRKFLASLKKVAR
ncbi:MAG: hypothetical protein QXZ28_00095 [Candidatus Methanomethylicaceae archaeon]|nr:hypothetical protein [Candidatus Verstraetearchaeota archaeon]